MKQTCNLTLLLVLSLGSFSQHTFYPVTNAVGIEVDTDNLWQSVGWGCFRMIY
jgi:hypothetical protein